MRGFETVGWPRFDEDPIRVSKRWLVALVGAWLVTTGAVHGAPNILVIVADDLGTDRLCRYRDDCIDDDVLPPGVASTPRLNEVIDAGIRFDNAWSNPVCSTTRATLLTGQYSRRNGILAALGPDSPEGLEPVDWTIPEMFDQLGAENLIEDYDTAAFGKWHLNAEARQNPPGVAAPVEIGRFDLFEGTRGNLMRTNSEATYCDFEWLRVVDTGNGTTVQQGFPDAYVTSFTVDRALEWVVARDVPEQPWFMYVAFHAPHTPLHHVDVGASGFSCGTPCIDQTNEADNIECYLEMISAMDTEIGRLLDGLAAANTDFPTVIFVGDNGAEAGVLDHAVYPEIPNQVEPDLPFHHAKTTVFEGGVRVPFVIGGTGVSTSGVATNLTQTSDLLMTVATLAGAEESAIEQRAPNPLDSVSLLPLLGNLAACDEGGPGCRTSAYAEIMSRGNNAVCDGDPSFCLEVKQSSNAVVYRSDTQPGFKLMRGCLPCDRPEPGTSLEKACDVTDCAQGECLYDLRTNRFEDNNIILSEPDIAAELGDELDTLITGALGQCLDPVGCPVACP